MCFATLLNMKIGFGKFSEYRKTKKLLEEFDWDERIVKPTSYSWCDRHATKQAVKQTGYLREYKDFLKRENH